MRAVSLLAFGLSVGTACGPWQRVGSDDQPTAGAVVPRLFSAGPIYRSMGLLVAGPPLPFIASVRYLDGGSPDSVLAVAGISLANQALRFHRDGAEFVAQYRVELAFRPDSGRTVQVSRQEFVRVRTFAETNRADESVIFQHMLRLAPGRYTVSVTVRDGTGPALNRAEALDTAPRFDRPMLGEPIPVYEGDGRGATGALPRLVTSPRATLPYGGDSLRVYFEAYGVPEATPLVLRVLDGTGTALRTDTATLQAADSGDVARVTHVLAPGGLPVGRLDLEATIAGAAPVRLPFLISFSGQYVITNYEEMVSLLRYFERQEAVAKLRDALPQDRSKLWDEFWRATDPVPITPENEALEDYFRRVQQANLRFPEEGAPGWLTDRGEVFITLGDPDEVVDQSSGLDRSGLRAIRWSYTELRLVLLFEDETGFGRFRLTPSSRSEYQRVLARVRRAQ
ncbi:MAG TPA: GWxTD domain-containing protein [Gemmatimonadales bacterium]|nr:GWxTD domain-containing protein [Gemmatimonadales bacterium]